MNASDASTGDHRSLIALTRVTDDENLATSLRRVAHAGRELLANCTSASVSVIAGGRPATMGSTDDAALQLDEAQYLVDDGPCLAAAREERLVRIDAVRADARWPAFSTAALHNDVASSLSVPLILEDAETYGAINVYGRKEMAFDTDDEAAAEGFAREAAVVVSNVVAYWTMFDRSTNLGVAMRHRGVIEQAKGILIGSHGCSPDEAFGILRRQSQSQNRRLRDVAAEAVTNAQHHRN